MALNLNRAISNNVPISISSLTSGYFSFATRSNKFPVAYHRPKIGHVIVGHRARFSRLNEYFSSQPLHSAKSHGTLQQVFSLPDLHHIRHPRTQLPTERDHPAGENSRTPGTHLRVVRASGWGPPCQGFHDSLDVCRWQGAFAASVSKPEASAVRHLMMKTVLIPRVSFVWLCSHV